MSTTALRCLAAREIVALMAQYQHGMESHVLPFKAFKHARWNSLLHVTPRMKQVEQVLAPWLCKYGTTKILHLLEFAPYARVVVATYALVKGRVDVVEILHEAGALDPMDSSHYFLAAFHGQIGVLRALNERQFLVTSESMDTAAMNGHLHVVEYIHSLKINLYLVRALEMAASNGHLDVVRFLHTKSRACTRSTMDRAAGNGHLNVVKFLHTHRKEGCTTWAMNFAAAHGHLQVVQFLHFNRTEGCTTLAMDDAAKNGHLEVVKFLHEHRQEGCTTDAMDGAARNGHIHVVQYLHKHRKEGCSLRARDLAIARGHTKLLPYLNGAKDTRKLNDVHFAWRWRDYFDGRP